MAAIDKEGGPVVIPDPIDPGTRRSTRELPHQFWDVAASDLIMPKRFETRIADELEVAFDPHEAHPIVRDPDRFADYHVALWSAVGAASGFRE
jgi:hypothetical protein